MLKKQFITWAILFSGKCFSINWATSATDHETNEDGEAIDSIAILEHWCGILFCALNTAVADAEDKNAGNGTESSVCFRKVNGCLAGFNKGCTRVSLGIDNMFCWCTRDECDSTARGTILAVLFDSITGSLWKIYVIIFIATVNIIFCYYLLRVSFIRWIRWWWFLLWIW